MSLNALQANTCVTFFKVSYNSFRVFQIIELRPRMILINAYTIQVRNTYIYSEVAPKGLYALYADAYKSYYPNQFQFRKGFIFLFSTTLNITSRRFSSWVPRIYIRIEFDPMSLGVSCIRSDFLFWRFSDPNPSSWVIFINASVLWEKYVSSWTEVVPMNLNYLQTDTNIYYVPNQLKFKQNLIFLTYVDLDNISHSFYS